MRYSELYPVDLVTLVREGDAGALDYLNSLSALKIRATVKAGSNWRPILIKAQVLKDWQDQPRDSDGRFGSGGGGQAPIRGIGGSSGSVISHIEVGSPREPHPGEVGPIAHFPTGTGTAPRPGMGDTSIGAKQLEEMKSSPVTGQYIRPDGTFTPERQALHDDIVRQAVAGASPQENPKMVMVGGGSASGKSSSLEQGKIDTPKDAVKVDSDEMARQLPEAKEMIAAGDKNWGAQTHEEGAYLAGRVQAAAQEKQANIVLDGGRASRMSDKIDDAHAAGYQVEGHIIARDPVAAQAEVAARPAGESKAPPDVISQRYSELSKTIPDIAPKFDSLTIHENRGTDANPELHTIATTQGGVLISTDSAGFNRFLASADPANHGSDSPITRYDYVRGAPVASQFTPRVKSKKGKGKKRKGKKRALKYSEDQPRVPAGEPGGGRFGSGGGDSIKPVGSDFQHGGGGGHQPEATSALDAHRDVTGPPPSPAAQAKASEMAAAAKAAEPETTAILHEEMGKSGGYILNATGTPGNMVLGRYEPPGVPNNALKSEGRLAEKIDTKTAALGPGATVDDGAAKIGDALRYTGISGSKSYSDTVKAAVQGLVNKGYTFDVGRWKNTWKPGEDYRGINSTVKAPNGTVFELQFHTPQSWDMKENGTHALYAEERKDTTPEDRKAELHQQQIDMATGMGASPPGAEGLTQEWLKGLSPGGGR